MINASNACTLCVSLCAKNNCLKLRILQRTAVKTIRATELIIAKSSFPCPYKKQNTMTSALYILIRLAHENIIPKNCVNDTISVNTERTVMITISVATLMPNIVRTVRYFAKIRCLTESGRLADTVLNPAFPSSIKMVAASLTVAIGSSRKIPSTHVDRFLISVYVVSPGLQDPGRAASRWRAGFPGRCCSGKIGAYPSDPALRQYV